MTRPNLRVLAVGLVAALALAACGGGGGGSDAPTASSLPKCPLDALQKASKPVVVEFWHALSRANEETLQRLTDQFNSSQQDVSVRLVNQIGYKENLEKFRAGLGGTALPDLIMVEDTATQQMIDTQATLPAQACIKADKYDTSDYLQRVLDRYTVDDVLWPMPFNVSNPVFYYDKNAFRAANLDPEDPPATLDEVKADALAIKGAGYPYGFGMKLDPWYLEQWSAKADKLYVNQENGRKARATKSVFNDATGREIFSWMADMVKTGAAKTNSADGPSQYDNLLGIRSKEVGMTIDSSGSLGTISQVLSTPGESGGVELGVGPMPGPPGRGGVLVGGGALYIVKRSAPEKQAAAWQYLKFLDSPQAQADFAAGTGYVPIRKSSIELPAIQNLWQANPGYKVAYDQLVSGVDSVATQGPVIGAYQAVRDAVLAGEQEMFTQGKSPPAALSSAANQADRAMQEYNSRVAG
jgi:sn-glycerol 3-phosphate transport system substrate-binding protein